MGWQAARRKMGIYPFRLFFIATVSLLGGTSANVWGQSPAITPEITIDQQELNQGGEDILRKALESGRHLFTTPYTPADGYGEGGAEGEYGQYLAGPREVSFEENVMVLARKLGIQPRTDHDKLRALYVELSPPFDGSAPPETRYPFLRLNGLDSQSCFECHNSIGSDFAADNINPNALARKPGVTGGPAGFASNAFINESFPSPLFMFIRNPPHVFGVGYTQRLAEEMTLELLASKLVAISDAIDHPGQWKSVNLEAKGMNFGVYRVKFLGLPKKSGVRALADANAMEVPVGQKREFFLDLMGAPGTSAISQRMPKEKTKVEEKESDEVEPEGPRPQRSPVADGRIANSDLGPLFEEDFGGIVGVSEDLVIRPFQWKGIASDERNFVKDALNFHFGMLPVEIEKEGEDDEDRDGVQDEVTHGNVSALTIFTMSLRPPTTDPESDQAERGRKLFSALPLGDDEDAEPVIPHVNSCASCHVPALTIQDQTVTVRDPGNAKEEFARKIGLSAARESTRQLPAFRILKKAIDSGSMITQDMVLDKETALKALQEAAKDIPGVQFKLTLEEFGPAAKLPSFTQPRLTTEDGAVDVPLFSDLKRHKMGIALQDKFDQTTDAAPIKVPQAEFLTRPLWGVADTGPWLHDGRATTLRQAILMHRSEDSEANESIDAFLRLPAEDQEAIIAFLLTLRLPQDPPAEAGECGS